MVGKLHRTTSIAAKQRTLLLRLERKRKEDKLESICAANLIDLEIECREKIAVELMGNHKEPNER